MAYAYTFTGGFRPDEKTTFDGVETTIKGMALIMLGKLAALRGDEVNPSSLSMVVNDGDLIFRADAVLDEDGLSPSQRRLLDEKNEASRLRDDAMAALRSAP